MDRIRLGISGCLLGQSIRFDGGHKRDAFLVDVLGPYVEWVPACPEVGAGLSAPRPSLRLVARAGETRLETADGGGDPTDDMQAWSRIALALLEATDLDGYVLKKDSPSCGLDRVRVYNSAGMPRRVGRGLFAAQLVERFPDLPVEEEGRLRDPRLREAFLERVFAHRRLKDSLSEPVSAAGVVDFHARHKLQLMAHSPGRAREMGRLVAGYRRDGSSLRAYRAAFGTAMSVPVSRGKNINVLLHALGYLREKVRRTTRIDLHDAVRTYASGEVPLIVPVSLIAHRVRDESITYLMHQTYFDPYPAPLGLRNAI